jgi:hypothetical protein
MVRLTLPRWVGDPLQYGFGNKPLVDGGATGIFAELAIQRLAEAEGWDARWVCTFAAKAEGPRYLKSWRDDSLDHQKNVPLDAEREVLLAKIAKQNHNSYSGCWDVLAWKGDRTLFIEAKHDKKDHIQATQLEWYWAALRSGLKPHNFVVAQWEFDREVAQGGPVRARGRLDGWDEVQANNLEEYPYPALPTYEGADVVGRNHGERPLKARFSGNLTSRDYPADAAVHAHTRVSG